MRNKLAILIIAASMSANAAPSTEELCAVPAQSSFQTALAGVNQFLSSSNPVLRHSGVQDTNIVRQQRVRQLPRLEETQRRNPSRPLPEAKVIFRDQSRPAESVISATPVYDDLPLVAAPELIEVPQAPAAKQAARLSPKTETLFNVIPNGIGSSKAVPQRIVLNKENFEIPKLEDETGEDEFEAIEDDEVDEVKESPKFEITISDTKPKQGTYDLQVNALKALSVGQYESSVSLYKKILNRSPRDKDALFGLATAYHQAGERKKARNAYGNLLRHFPKFEEGINNFISLASQEAPEHALEELKALQKTNPKFPAIFAQKGLIYSKLGDKKQAIKNLAYALKLDQNNNDYKYNLAILLDEVGKAEYAAQLYRELVKASLNGEDIPVGRNHLEERIAYIIASLEA